MPYREERLEPWGEKAKARSQRRREYFRKYQLEKYGVGADRESKPNNDDSTGVYGEKIALSQLAKSKWAGGLHDIDWRGKKLDVKTSLISVFGPYERWKFSLARQKRKVDLFLLICLDRERNVQRMFLVPDSKVTAKNITIMVGGKTKYAAYEL